MDTVKVNKISLMQEGGQMAEQVMTQPQQQSVDPAIKQISDFISESITQGQNPAEVVMSLVEQQVDQQTIGQALMMNGFEEDDITSLFQELNQSQDGEEISDEAATPDELTDNPQEISRNKNLEPDDISEEIMNEPGMAMAKSGIEIKPENEGKFTRWAKARGMSVQEAASKVMANTDEYPTAVVKMANFAKNAASFNKEYGGENYQTGGTPQGKVGAVNNAYVKKSNNFQRAPLYINPMAFEYSNDNFSLGKAAAVAYGGYKEFLSNADDNKDGVKDGFFRDGNKKEAIRDANKGSYYNYNITQDANDPNKYMVNNTDLYNAAQNQESLRNIDQYNKDVASNSRFNYDTNINDYNFITSSRPIDERIYNSPAQKNALMGKDYNYLKQMISDKDAMNMIMDTRDDPEAGLLNIDQYGKVSSTRPGRINPNEYNTYMGINKFDQNAMIPIGNEGQPIPAMVNGGDLDKAQFGIPKILSGLQNNFQPFQDVNDYFNNMGQTNYALDTQAVANSQLKNKNFSLGNTQSPTNATFQAPQVEITNELEGGLNRFMDSPGIKGYGKLSNFAVQGADVINDYFRDVAVNQAREDNFNKLGADYQYAIAEDPFNKRGMFDINTGSAGSESDRTTGLYMSKYGGENKTVNVDSNLLAKLIAAGADIEIL